MKNDYVETGMYMFGLELIAFLVFYISFVINWSVDLFVMLIGAGMFLIFNLTAFILIISGLLKKDEKR